MDKKSDGSLKEVPLEQEYVDKIWEELVGGRENWTGSVKCPYALKDLKSNMEVGRLELTRKNVKRILVAFDMVYFTSNVKIDVDPFISHLMEKYKLTQKIPSMEDYMAKLEGKETPRNFYVPDTQNLAYIKETLEYFDTIPESDFKKGIKFVNDLLFYLDVPTKECGILYMKYRSDLQLYILNGFLPIDIWNDVKAMMEEGMKQLANMQKQTIFTVTYEEGQRADALSAFQGQVLQGAGEQSIRSFKMPEISDSRIKGRHGAGAPDKPSHA